MLTFPIGKNKETKSFCKCWICFSLHKAFESFLSLFFCRGWLGVSLPGTTIWKLSNFKCLESVGRGTSGGHSFESCIRRASSVSSEVQWVTSAASGVSFTGAVGACRVVQTRPDCHGLTSMFSFIKPVTSWSILTPNWAQWPVTWLPGWCRWTAVYKIEITTFLFADRSILTSNR